MDLAAANAAIIGIIFGDTFAKSLRSSGGFAAGRDSPTAGAGSVLADPLFFRVENEASSNETSDTVTTSAAPKADSNAPSAAVLTHDLSAHCASTTVTHHRQQSMTRAAVAVVFVTSASVRDLAASRPEVVASLGATRRALEASMSGLAEGLQEWLERVVLPQPQQRGVPKNASALDNEEPPSSLVSKSAVVFVLSWRAARLLDPVDVQQLLRKSPKEAADQLGSLGDGRTPALLDIMCTMPLSAAYMKSLRGGGDRDHRRRTQKGVGDVEDECEDDDVLKALSERITAGFEPVESLDRRSFVLKSARDPGQSARGGPAAAAAHQLHNKGGEGGLLRIDARTVQAWLAADAVAKLRSGRGGGITTGAAAAPLRGGAGLAWANRPPPSRRGDPQEVWRSSTSARSSDRAHTNVLPLRGRGASAAGPVTTPVAAATK